MPNTYNNRADWLDAFTRFIIAKSNSDEPFARDCAEAGADQQQEEHGPNPEDWDSPEDCAYEEMSCWDPDDPTDPE